MADKVKVFLEFTFDVPEGDKRDMLSVYLAQMPFQGLIEEETKLIAYVENSLWEPTHMHEVNEISSEHSIPFDIQEVQNKNWNSIWEENFRPILIPKVVYIHSSFHPKIELSKSVTRIQIDPKMAFGTGHHATTKMMISELKQLPVEGKKILDFGAGTGILSIAASMWKAKRVWAVEIEKQAFENMEDNLKANQVKNVKTYRGDHQSIPDKKFHIALANVNTQVLLELPKWFKKRIKKGGYLLLSGVLEKDAKEVTKAYKRYNFKLDNTQYEGDWAMLSFRRK